MRPGSASSYFTVADRARPLGETTTQFSISDAWWLAELSRLIYRGDRTGDGRSRHSVLREQGLREHLCIDGEHVRCALIVPDRDASQVGGVLVFCGTRGARNGIADLDAPLVTWRGKGKVHRGFRDLFEKAWPKLEAPLASCRSPLYFTGHSMGGAVAAIAASWRPPHALYTFGAPRVGDQTFATSLNEVCSFRIVNGRDLVAALPPVLPALPYVHIGAIEHLEAGAVGLASDAPKRRDDNRVSSPRAPWLTRWIPWTKPPARLSDHAPVNYVARLATRLGLHHGTSTIDRLPCC